MLERWTPQITALFRIMCGLLMLEHGLQKLFQFPPPPVVRPFPLISLIGLSAVLELLGGLLLTVGLATRITAFVLSGEMAFAYFIRHAPTGFYPINNGGELAIVYCFGFLLIAAIGGGAWALDEVRSKVRPA